jgi:hypothetical protein
MKKSRLMWLDCDCKGGPPREWRLAHPVPTNTDHARRVLEREWRAEKLGSLVRAAQDALPAEDVLIQRTRHGFHACVLLDEMTDVGEVAALAERWRGATAAIAGGIPMGCGLEAFPVVGSDGTGRSCALPLGASQRLVATDLVHDAHRTRALDFERLFSAGLSSALELRKRLAMMPQMRVAGRRRLMAVAPVQPRGLGQLFGPEFVIEALRIGSEGMGLGESWDALRRIVFALPCVGMSDGQAMFAFERFVRALGLHGANHCRSERGIRALLQKARCQLRRFRRAEGEKREDGRPRCWRNGLRSRDLRAALWGLIGEVPKESVRSPRGKTLNLKVSAHLAGTELGRFMAA